MKELETKNQYMLPANDIYKSLIISKLIDDKTLTVEQINAINNIIDSNNTIITKAKKYDDIILFAQQKIIEINKQVSNYEALRIRQIETDVEYYTDMLNNELLKAYTEILSQFRI